MRKLLREVFFNSVDEAEKVKKEVLDKISPSRRKKFNFRIEFNGHKGITAEEFFKMLENVDTD